MNNIAHSVPNARLELGRTLAAMTTRRWPLVLCGARSKRPAPGPSWPISTDPEQVRAHVTAGGNVGLVCGERSGVIILDPDNRPAWEALAAGLGAPGLAWVETGSGRRHVYCAYEPDLPAKLIGLDGQVIGEIQRGPRLQHALVPPSIHPVTRAAYRWLVDPATAPLTPTPAPWRAWLRSPRKIPAGQEPAGALHHPSGRRRPLRLGVRQGLVAVALRQPGAVRRPSGAVKFACPACRAAGFDASGDNAVLFPDGRWGCARAAATALGRAHWDAIGLALGAIR